MLLGLYLLCKDEEEIRDLRSILQNYKPKNGWASLRNYLRKFEDEIFTKLHTDLSRILKIQLMNLRHSKLTKKWKRYICLVKNYKI